MEHKKKRLFTSVKIALTAILAILFADFLQLDFSISAGIVAILTVGPTKKETVKTARNRFYAFIVALGLAFVCFSLFGYGFEGFFMYLLLFIWQCQIHGWASAMAMNSVLISHFLTFEAMTVATVANELALFFIGVGLGVLVNLHLHENRDYIQKMEDETDEQIKAILATMAQRIATRDMEDRNGVCFTSIHKSISIARQIAEENHMNQLKEQVNHDLRYIQLREQQTHILYNIYKRVRKLNTTPVTAECISQFLQKLSDAYHKENRADGFLEEFYELRQFLRDSPLPVTRKEFEDRAELYGVLGDIEEFMLAKKMYLDQCT